VKLFCWSTAHASSSVTRFMRSKISSGTLGRPSGKRSPCQSGVYLTTSSRVKNPCCACVFCAVAAIRPRHKIAHGIWSNFFFIVWFCSPFHIKSGLVQTRLFPGFVLFAPLLHSSQRRCPVDHSQ